MLRQWQAMLSWCPRSLEMRCSGSYQLLQISSGR